MITNFNLLSEIDFTLADTRVQLIEVLLVLATRKRLAAREHFVEHAAHGPDIRLRSVRAVEQLRGLVLGCAPRLITIKQTNKQTNKQKIHIICQRR